MTQKSLKERYKRLKYFEASLDVIRDSRYNPEIRQNPHKKSEVFYRFGGMTRDGTCFYVQIKENVKTRTKQCMSVFPAK